MERFESRESRGRYDRSLSREQRATLERQAIEQAIVDLLATGRSSLTVKDVSVRARVARNTVYMHFGDVAEAVAHVLHEIRRSVSLAIVERRQGMRAPRARCGAVAEAWLEFSRNEPQRTLLFVTGAPAPSSGALELLESELGAVALEAQAAGLIGRTPSRDVLATIAAAFCHTGARVAAGKARSPVPELVDFLTELTLQILRVKSGS